MKALARDLGIGKSLVRVRMGKPVVKDIPLLIRALSIRDDYTRSQAHMWLVKLAGADHGTEAAGWSEWWQRERPGLLRHEADETATGVLFARLRDAVMRGRWGTAVECLSPGARAGLTSRELVRNLVDRRQELRAAFRDAKVSEARVAGEGGGLSVQWGEVGFDQTQLPLVRELGRWYFDALPWSGPLVECSTPDGVHTRAPVRRSKRKWGWDPVAVQVGAVLLIAFVIGVIVAVKAHWVPPLAPLAVLVAAIPVALLLRRLLSRPRFKRENGKLVH